MRLCVAKQESTQYILLITSKKAKIAQYFGSKMKVYKR